MLLLWTFSDGVGEAEHQMHLCKQTGALGGKMEKVQKVRGQGLGDLGGCSHLAGQFKGDELLLFGSGRQGGCLREKATQKLLEPGYWAYTQTLPLTHCVTLVVTYNVCGPQFPP